MKLLDGKIDLQDYHAVCIKDKNGKVIGVCFPIDGFYDLVEDIEDYSYLEGYDPDSDESISHENILKEFNLTPENMKEIRREMGLTQASFGEKIGYAAGSIRNMETGQQKISNRVTLAVKNLKHKSVG